MGWLFPPENSLVAQVTLLPLFCQSDAVWAEHGSLFVRVAPKMARVQMRTANFAMTVDKVRNSGVIMSLLPVERE
jgi:hypothetical protein